VKRLDQAGEHVRAALRQRPHDVTVLQAAADFYLFPNQLGDAEKCLRDLVGQKDKEPAAAARARRTLALVLAAGGNYQQSREALPLPEQAHRGQGSAAAGTEPVEDERARAVVLATQWDRQHAREAVHILEGLDRRRPLAGEDLFLLVQLYDRLG